MKQLIKKALCRLLVLGGVDSLGRRLNRHKVLVVMYHGVTETFFQDPVWTQLPAKVFEEQMKFLSTHFQPISLSDFIGAVKGEKAVPERAVLITFDDGLRNNARVAFPILQTLHIPAAIFLTVDYIGTGTYIWTDELYFLVLNAVRNGVKIPGLVSNPPYSSSWECYFEAVEHLKLCSDTEREEKMAEFRHAVPFIDAGHQEEFRLLNWEEVRSMAESGLVEFGVHTATHKILSRLADDDLDQEVVHPKRKMERLLGRKVETFCYPNGRSGVDFSPAHQKLLQKAGYCCAFATDHGLYTIGDDPMVVKRIAAGNDMTSQADMFRLTTSGIF